MKQLQQTGVTSIFSLLLLTAMLPHLFSQGPEPGWEQGTSRDPATSTYPVTVFIAGNSTASNGADKGWGSHLQCAHRNATCVVEGARKLSAKSLSEYLKVVD